MGFIGLLLLLFVYLIPAIVAYARHHRNAAPITITTLLFGWTFIGWCAALIWSTTSNVEHV